MKTAYIIDGIRSPIGSLGGSLSRVRPDDLAAVVIRELLKRNTGVPPELIDDLILGCANQSGEDNRNVARMAGLLSGLPPTVSGITVNRLCASGLSATIQAAYSIIAGEADFVIAGGVESMTRAPYVLSKADAAFGRGQEIFDTTLGWRFVNPRMKEQFGVDSMGETAENVAKQFKISREDQDKFAAWSQQKANDAVSKGRHTIEITAVSVPQPKGDPVVFDRDEFSRPDTTPEKLARLKPAFNRGADGSVTAGNSSGLNDGAAALLLASEEAVKKYNLKPLARFVASASAGVEPRIMGIGPVEASRKALARAGIKISDIDVIELNEAFAAQSLACTRELGLADNDPRINPNGGAIALGHPLGMSGARLVLTAARELEITKKKYSLCTMCVGVGQGVAGIWERV
jgi:3-oxoadipyl-CoA thiolase